MIDRDINLKYRFEFDDSPVTKIGFNPYYFRINSEQKDPLVVNGKNMINLATNNYLGLSNDERIKEAYIKAINKYGVSMCATPVAGGYTELFDITQEKLSNFIGVEKVLIYPSCYQANNGIFQMVARKEDLILFDRFSHSSLIQGIKVVGCKILPFNHNNLESLEYLLNKASGFEKVFVVTESVFSTEGVIAPFKEINDLCMKYQAVPVVDDSHGIGVIGKNGKGILSYCEIENFQGIYTSSLGKALANNCGIVGGNNELINFLSYFSSHLVYSTAVSPAVLAGITKTLEILDVEYEWRAKILYTYSNLIKSSLNELGFNISDSKAPINSIIMGSTEKTLEMAKKIFKRDILSTPFVYPSVPKNDGRIRMIAGVNLMESTIEKVLKIFKEFRQN